MGKSQSKPKRPPTERSESAFEQKTASSRRELERAMAKLGPFPASPAAPGFPAFWDWVEGCFWTKPPVSENLGPGMGDLFVPESPNGRVLVVCGSPGAPYLVEMALERRWTVVAVARRGDRGGEGGGGDYAGLQDCIAFARTRSSFKTVGVVGISRGAYRVCKAHLAGARVVSISNMYDYDSADSGSEDGSCVREISRAKSPTLLINSANDPEVPKCFVELGESLARGTALVSSVTTPRGGGGHAGRLWAFELALEFCAGGVTFT